MFYDLVDEMHSKFGFYDSVREFNLEKFLDFLEFRTVKQKQEEVNELEDAINMVREGIKNNDEALVRVGIHEINDAIVDLLVFTFGTATFTMSKTELEKSYQTVMDANLRKQVGIKPGRPNPMGLPDLIKPTGWTSPDITPYSQCLQELISGLQTKKEAA